MTPEQIHILQHSLGLTRGREIYRNHFVTGEGSKDHANCITLIATGFMTRHAGSELTGGDDCFTVTESGKVEALAALPPEPKLTPSQRRYREYLSAETGESFIDYLRRATNKCAWCCATPVLTNLDSEWLCRPCANIWIQGERQAYFEAEAEGAFV